MLVDFDMDFIEIAIESLMIWDTVMLILLKILTNNMWKIAVALQTAFTKASSGISLYLCINLNVDSTFIEDSSAMSFWKQKIGIGSGYPSTEQTSSYNTI